jgi:hypothetical protein
MRHALRTALLSAALAAVPAAAFAGWETTWTNTPVKAKGERMTSQNSTMKIEGGQVRIDQPDIISLIDYNTGKYTIINPTKQYFWTGTVDDFVREMVTKRDEKLTDKFPNMPKPDKNKKNKKNAKNEEYAPPKVDVAKLPPVSVIKTATTEKIAGYDTVKYEIKANGELFEEIWVAPALDMSSDLNVDKYLAVQRKLAAAKRGSSGERINATYLNEEYRKVLEKSVALKVVVHHIAGGYERIATSVKQVDVPATDFSVPNQYRRVRLTDLMPPPPQGMPQPPQGMPPSQSGQSHGS